MVFLLTVVILALFLTSCMHNTIIFPVKHMGNICNYVTGGNFTVRVKVNNNDEIGLLGNTVNEMIEGLYERFELSKFVSSSTLQSIKSQDKGTKARLN